MNITDVSHRLFLAYALDAANWSGTPLVGGNVGGTRQERGNLTQLKRAGLITTFVDGGDTWIDFTPAGVQLAHSLGIGLGAVGEDFDWDDPKGQHQRAAARAELAEFGD